MKALRQILNLLRREKVETEMAEEMRLHVELQTERNIAAGMKPDEARYAALRQFGNVGSIQQQAREGRGLVWLEQVGQNLRYAFRYLAKAPGFTATAILTLALCIGATTAIFSTVYSLMLKPLPFHEPERIVELYSSFKKVGLNKMPANVPIYRDYSENATSYEALGLWTNFESMFGADDAVMRLSGVRTTAEIFHLLRIQPVIGSFFTMEQNRPGAGRVVVLTQSFWQSQFLENPEVVGQDLRIDGETYKVIGVAPRAFEAFDARVKFIVPQVWAPSYEHPHRRSGVGPKLFGRLKSSVTIGQADAEAKTLERHFLEGAPPYVKDDIERSGMTMNVGGVQEQRVQPVRPTLLLLQGGVAFVLLIGCVNVANLLLVRANARQSELAIRSALGASRGTITRQLLLESLMLTFLGSLLGLGVASAALRVTNFYLAKMLPQSLPASLDLRVLGFAIGLTVLVGVVIGLIPVFHVLRTNLTEIIQRSSRAASSGRGIRAMSSLLVIAQVAVALVLLIGAGLLIRSFERALSVDTGLDAKNVVTGRIALPHRSKAVKERLLQGMREIPGVTSVALSFDTPFQDGLKTQSLTLKQDTLPPGSPQPHAHRIYVTPDYFMTLGLTLVEGRFFEEADLAPNRIWDGYSHLLVVDESFAQKFWPKGSAIGGRISFEQRPEQENHWSTIIGIVRNVPHNGVEDKSGNPFVYQLMGGEVSRPTFFLRTSRPVADIVASMREKLHAIDPGIPLFDTGPLEKAVDSSFDNRRAVMLLLAAFAGLALFLSALGIYGVLAYDVSQRTREIGIRGALGAARAQVVGMIFRQGLRKTAIGLVAGLTGAWLLSRYMTSLLFEVEPTDAVTFIGVSGLLLAVAMLACWLPARRAAKVDPVVALRAE